MEGNGCLPDAVTFETVIRALFEKDENDMAEKLLREMIFQDPSVKGYRPNVWTYTIMINGLCKEGLLHEALAFLSKMEDNGCLPNAVTYEIIIRALFEKGENDNAEKLLREMLSRGLLQGEK
ncbi:hypothetical protein Ahy_B05g075379 [Arachis hypogaea]|uniref:Pentatricopeptide repeat-containing protein n=1 Tax=Arachis hypogaea TaxID=3818 RepID=A0A444Z122_ARAHY|nr:hypothetical protein Ahy_B05g075379 [Arachis hypogaea]